MNALIDEDKPAENGLINLLLDRYSRGLPPDFVATYYEARGAGLNLADRPIEDLDRGYVEYVFVSIVRERGKRPKGIWKRPDRSSSGIDVIQLGPGTLS